MHFKIRLEFKPQDLWVGAFWQRRNRSQHRWICLLPMVPIHLQWKVAELDQIFDNFDHGCHQVFYVLLFLAVRLF